MGRSVNKAERGTAKGQVRKQVGGNRRVSEASMRVWVYP